MALSAAPYPRLAFLLLLLSTAGCVLPPEHAGWKKDQAVVAPAPDRSTPAGTLVVETVLIGSEKGLNQRNPFHLYDEGGQYLTHFPNDSMDPVRLPVGRYVVVSSILLHNKRVQVQIQDGLTTHVSLSDFKSAPDAE